MIEPVTAEQIERDYVFALHCMGRMVLAKPEMKSPSRRLFDFAQYRGVTVEQIRGKSRKRPLVFHRQDAMRMLFEKTKLSLPQIGRLVNRDHTTVLHGIKASERRASQ